VKNLNENKAFLPVIASEAKQSTPSNSPQGGELLPVVKYTK